MLIMKKRNYKYKYNSWFAKEFGKLSRKIFPQFKVKELRTFPIPVSSMKIQNEFEKIVTFCTKKLFVNHYFFVQKSTITYSFLQKLFFHF